MELELKIAYKQSWCDCFLTHLHLREESVDAGDGVEEDVGRQVVPHLEAAQDVRGPVPHPAGDGRWLNDPRRDGGHLSRRRLDWPAVLGLHLDAFIELAQERLDVEGLRLKRLLLTTNLRVSRRQRRRRSRSTPAAGLDDDHRPRRRRRFRLFLRGRRVVVRLEVAGGAEQRRADDGGVRTPLLVVRVQLVLLLLGRTGSDLHHAIFVTIHPTSFRFPETIKNWPKGKNSSDYRPREKNGFDSISRLCVVFERTLPTKAGQTLAWNIETIHSLDHLIW